MRNKTSIVPVGPTVQTGEVMGLPQAADDGSFTAQFQEGLKGNEKKAEKISLTWEAKKEWKSNHVVLSQV